VRLQTLRWVAVVVAVVAGCWPRHRPNVLLVTIDTLRADRVGCYGFALAQTPAMDGLARDGVRCSDAITAAPITLPSHATILTGLYPPAHGVRDNGAYALSDRVVTLAERLHDAGYETQAFVSAIVLDRHYNLTQGFDGYDDDLWTEDSPPLFMIRDRPAARTAARALAWLERWYAERRRPPFFAWVHFFDPHQPYRTQLVDRILAPTRYDAEIAAADRGLGQLLDWLRAKRLLDDTLVVVTADHGESLGEHEERTHALFIYDATVRIPMLWRYPRLLPRGRVYEDPVRTVDIVPTVLGVLGLPGGRETQGVDLVPAFAGRVRFPDLPQYSESLLAEVGFGMAPLYGVRVGGHKWIRAPKPELYDLHADPAELANRYPAEAALGTQLDGVLQTVLDDSARVAIPAADSPMDGQTIEALHALGYLAPAGERAGMHGIDPKDGIALYNDLEEARHLAQHDDWTGAEELLRRILAVTPANTTALNILGLTLQHENRVEEAEASYAASLAAEPRQHRVYAMLGALALQRRDLDTAERRYREALAITPVSVEAMGFLGFIAAERGDDAGAMAWYEKAAAADPGFPHVYRRIGDLYFERADYARALAAYRRVLAMMPDHFEALVQAGNSARHGGDVATAIEYYERARTVRPDSWIPPYNLACVKAVAGDVDTALALVDQAIDAGFRAPSLLDENDDFASLRATARWPELRERAEAAERFAEREPGRLRTPGRR